MWLEIHTIQSLRNSWVEMCYKAYCHSRSLHNLEMSTYGSLARYADCACTGNAGNVFPVPRVSDSGMHHGTCMTHVPWCMPESLTRGLLWSRWQGKRSRHSRRMRNPQFYVSGKKSMIIWIFHEYHNIHALWYSLKYTDKQILMRNLRQTDLTLRMLEYINSETVTKAS